MSRPASIEDLSAEARQGEVFAEFQTNLMPPTAALLAATAAFLKAAEAAHIHISNDRYRGIRLHNVKTAEELIEALESAQNTWDERRRAYDAVLAVGNPPTDSWERNRLTTWSRENDLPEPWTIEAAVDADGRVQAMLSTTAA